MEKITPDDIRYRDLAEKRFNKRYTGKPAYIRVPTSTAEVIDAVQDAVTTKRRIVVRSGGHCLEGFVSDPTVQVLVDMVLMKDIGYDVERSAFVVSAGVTVGEMYRRLFLGWGVILPAGEHPDIGIGGHVLGGAFGFLCRAYGLAADYLYAVELVTVDESGKAHSVVATREVHDPNRELWWAHTGGGGGNFGIVTRYWLRSYDSSGTDPYEALPKAPSLITTFNVSWEWKNFSQQSFSNLLRNFGRWCADNGRPDVPQSQLFTILFLNHRNLGKIEIKGLSTSSNATELIDEHLTAILKSVDVAHKKQVRTYSWLSFALNPFPELFQPGSETVASKVKDALFRQSLTESQIAIAYKYLTSEVSIAGGLGLASYGGKVNSIQSDATASAQRDCIMDVACNTGWTDPKAEEPSLHWVRNFYKDLFADSGGVPVPNEQTDGCMINHPDADLAGTEWNKSGVPWHELYYRENYHRLQKVKSKFDPLNIFFHALSIRGVDSK